MDKYLPYSEPGNPHGTAGNENRYVTGMRLGLLPDQGRPAIQFRTLSKAEAPLAIPLADDHITGVPAWNLGQNNTYGTCGPTSLANYITMVYWNLLGVQVTVSDNAIFDLYRASGNPGFPAQDNGVDLNYMLTQSLTHGLEVTYTGVFKPDVYRGAPPVAGAAELVKPVGFAQLSVAGIDEVRRATAVLGGACLGVTLDVSQQGQTATGAWDYAPSATWGGHAVMGAAYTGRPDGADEEIISWQKPVGLSDAFVASQLDQGFAVVLPCHLTHPNFLAGVDVSEFAAQFQELTGRSFPAS